MNGRRISYYFDPQMGNFIFSFGHPMKPVRINMVHELISSYGLDLWMKIKRGKKISVEEFGNFHEEEHLENIFTAFETNIKFNIESYFPLNKGEDCPIFSGLTQFVNFYTRGSISGANDLSKNEADIVINWAGGFHHAKNNELSGFCYINDVIFSILELLKTFKKILYIDIDAHHGDGVEEAFYLSNRVLCLSFHNYQKFFFPETGNLKNHGDREGRNYSINFPLKPGIKDNSFESIFQPILKEILNKFVPNAIVFQSGADSLSKDPIGKFNLSLNGHGKCIQFLKDTSLPLLVLGGGGYKISNVSRCWAYETSLMLDKKISDRIPYNIYWQRYRGFLKLNFKISKSFDRNSKKTLLNLTQVIIKNVRKLKIIK